jgi:transcriptional regulator with XRE-family HTH domain
MKGFEFVMGFDGKRLGQLRKLKGLTQKELANKLNKAKSTVSGYEINNSEPDTNTLVKMALLLETTTDYLLGLADEPHKKIYNFNEIPEFLKGSGIEDLSSLMNCELKDLNLDILEELVLIGNKIKKIGLLNKQA